MTNNLSTLVKLIDQDLGAVPDVSQGESAQIIRVTRTGEVAIRSLDGAHPYDALVGFVAPADWEVFGVIAPGNGASAERGRCRVRVVYLIDRDGTVASILRFSGDDEAADMGEAPIGRVSDCVLRAMDLPTPHEADDTIIAYWWDRVLKRLAGRRTAVANVASIIDIIDEMRPSTWDDERWQVVRDGGNDVMEGTMAAWMDQGMFARTMLASIGDPEELLPSAKANCTPEVWSALLHHFAEVALGGEA